MTSLRTNNILYIHQALINNIICIITVLYAGELGQKGLDMDQILTRLEVFKETKVISCMCETEVQKLADLPIPFIPELSYFGVVSIHKG